MKHFLKSIPTLSKRVNSYVLIFNNIHLCQIKNYLLRLIIDKSNAQLDEFGWLLAYSSRKS